MTDVDFILGLIAARANHLCSSAHTTAGREGHDWEEKRPLYAAEADALQALAKEISASIPTSARQTPSGLQLQPNWRWVLATEMGGAMNATIFNDISAAQEAKDRFCNDHGLLNDFEPHAACGLQQVHLPPRRTRVKGALDGRFAFILYMDSSVSAEIYETLEEVEAAIEYFTERFGDDPMYGYHEILVPWVRVDEGKRGDARLH